MSEMPSTAHVPEWDQADRMRKALRHAGVGVQEMADYLGVSRNAASTWINGRIKPSSQTVRLWALRTGVPYEWLRDGVSSSGDPDGPAGVNARSPRRPVADGDEECAIRDSNAEPAGLAHRRVLPFPAAARLAVAA